MSSSTCVTQPCKRGGTLGGVDCSRDHTLTSMGSQK